MHDVIAVGAGLSDTQPMEQALAAFQHARDVVLQERYDSNLAQSRMVFAVEAGTPA